MSQDGRLERWFRLLLWGYPRRYRRERGAELLTTLLEAAPPDTHRPGIGDAFDIVRGGLRCRFAIPRGPGNLLVATVIALWIAVLAFLAATEIGWRAGSDRVDQARAAAVMRTAMGGEPTSKESAGDVLSTVQSGQPAPDLPAGRVVSADYVGGWYFYSPPPTPPTSMVDDARARLAADGWRLQSARSIGSETVFWATRDSESVRVASFAGGPGVGASIGVRVHGSGPRFVTVAALTATVLAGVFGWLLAGRMLRAARAADPRRRSSAAAVGLPSLTVAGLLVAVVAVVTVRSALDGWWAYDTLLAVRAVTAVGPFAFVGVAGPLVAVLLLRFGPRGSVTRPDGGGWRAAWRVATIAHAALLGSAALVLAIYVVRLWTTGGDRDGMVSGEYDPKDLPLIGGNPANPLMWVLMVAGLLFTFAPVLSPMLLAASVPVLAATRRRLSRRRWTLLLAMTVVGLAVPLLRLSGLGQDVSAWLLD